MAPHIILKFKYCPACYSGTEVTLCITKEVMLSFYFTILDCNLYVINDRRIPIYLSYYCRINPAEMNLNSINEVITFWKENGICEVVDKLNG